MRIVRDLNLSTSALEATLKTKEAEYEALQHRFNALISHRPSEAAGLIPEMLTAHEIIVKAREELGIDGDGITSRTSIAATPISGTELRLRLGH